MTASGFSERRGDRELDRLAGVAVDALAVVTQSTVRSVSFFSESRNAATDARSGAVPFIETVPPGGRIPEQMSLGSAAGAGVVVPAAPVAASVPVPVAPAPVAVRSRPVRRPAGAGVDVVGTTVGIMCVPDNDVKKTPGGNFSATFGDDRGPRDVLTEHVS